MSTKGKGTRAERELLHLFWDAGWACTRAAGSGSIPLPSPDLLCGNGSSFLALECKALRGSQKSFSFQEIADLEAFALRFGAQAYVALRFDRSGWFFLSTKALKKTARGNYSVTLRFAQEQGLSFAQLVGGHL